MSAELGGKLGACSLYALPRIGSDHNPLLFESKTEEASPRRPFRFEAMWMEDDKLREIVEEGWKERIEGPYIIQVAQKLRYLKARLKEWSKRQFGNIMKQKTELRNRLELLGDQEAVMDQETREKESEMVAEYHEVLRKEEIYWKQRARTKWLQEGDKNTKFFHATATKHQGGNRIVEIRRNSGQVTTDREEIKEEVVKYFQELLRAEGEVDLENSEILASIPKLVTRQDNEELLRPFSEVEIRKVVFAMRGDRAPGPDGFPASFYQQYWDIIGGDVTKMVQEYLYRPEMPPGVNVTFLVLIPKVPGTRRLDQFRPISLCNTILKIITKAIAMRLQKILPKIISHKQGGFIKGRSITDSIIAIHEVLHSVKKDKRDGMIIKLDMSQAYDRVSWAFLDKVLKHFSFSQDWIRIVNSCIKSPRFSVMINGEPARYFKSGRGIRQGDPLSPYLFILMAEALGRSFTKAGREGRLSGIGTAGGNPNEVIRQFVDDAAVVSLAEVASARETKRLLGMYEQEAGQKVNYTKSKIYFINTNFRRRHRICSILGCGEGSLPANYLGIPMFTGSMKPALWSPVVENFSSKLAGWKGCLLSQAGKLQLVKSVLQSLPIYFMSLFQMPEAIRKRINHIQRTFLWSALSPKQGPNNMVLYRYP